MELTHQTPMMKQYFSLRENNPDCLLFFRLGDFYELFFQDAIDAAKALDITLTKRGKEGSEIPMCGVPVHAYETYLPKLIRQGFKVAICEQTETPEEAKKRDGYKAIVKRDITRIVTPGTLTEETLLSPKKNNYLAALFIQDNNCSLAWSDISTGDFYVSSFDLEKLNEELSAISPSEILISDTQFSKSFKGDFVWSQLPNLKFDFGSCSKRLLELFELVSLDALGDLKNHEIITTGALVDYLYLTQKTIFSNLQRPKKITHSKTLSVDTSTKKNLELFYALNGEYKGSLISIIDKTMTSCGGRLLHEYMMIPSTDLSVINARLDAVEYFLNNTESRPKLSMFPDIERSLTRLFYDRGGPRDLLSIQIGLKTAALLKSTLINPPYLIQELSPFLNQCDELIILLERALGNDLPLQVRDGGFIKVGYDLVLDEYRKLKNEADLFVSALQERYINETGITSLKIKQNNILGFFIEVTSTHTSKTPQHFIHRQTTANGIRYTTSELIDLEQKIINAKEESLKLEISIFQNLRERVLSMHEKIKNCAKAIATVDVLSNFSYISNLYNYSKPLLDESLKFEIHQGRHPVVELYLSKENETFVPNDTTLENEHRMWLLTGPNMAGKSTFLRQNAIIAYMAQIGSFVPAQSAHIGIVDRIFTRVGASDDLTKGQSTFMVEMIETAAILNQSTPRSLIILDEIGRGTSTYDGLSIAWATLEHLEYVNKSRGIFATHYHELTDLCKTLKHLSPYTMKVTEWESKIIFQHQVLKGAADRSYGIHVASLAGLPKIVTKRASEILKTLQEKSESRNFQNKILNNDRPIQIGFPQMQISSKIEIQLKKTNLDNLSPKEALDMLYSLKSMIKN